MRSAKGELIVSVAKRAPTAHSSIRRSVISIRPDLAPTVTEVVDAYLRARYGHFPDDLTKLRTAIARLP